MAYWYTEEGEDGAEQYLNDNNIKYEWVNNAVSMMYVWNEHGKQYIYWPSTGRWRARYAQSNTTYRSKGVEDFHKRFLNNVWKEKEKDNANSQ